ncbi:YvcK family protein [Candidatus Kuenenbacteria bacterium]|nr:YvcK family protein [Candidatus Kuenenbacteria bacterium]
MKITTIGGGTGQFILLTALKDIENIDLTSVVSMVDSGGSTGKLRDQYGVLPPGDILKCLIALSPYKEARQILQSRFESNEKLKNHNSGNLLLTFLTQRLGDDFPSAVEAMGEILNIKGKVFPVTIDKSTLVAELENGEYVYSESAIDIVRQGQGKISKTFLVPHGGRLQVYPPVLDAIENADYIFLGPGDLFTSIIPNFLVRGVREALQKTNAKIVYVLNIMTKFGETDGFTAEKFVSEIEKYIERPVDIVIANKKIPDEVILVKYNHENSRPVVFDLQDNLIDKNIVLEDLIFEGDLARHDVEKLKNVILELFTKE